MSDPDLDKIARELAAAYDVWAGLHYEEDWRARARCRNRGPTKWFVEDIRPGWRRMQHEEEARQFCHGCRVRGSCLVEALANPREVGIWGGQTEEERDTTRRKIRRVRVRLRSAGYGDYESLQAV